MNTKQRIIDDLSTPFSTIYRDDNNAHDILTELLIKGEAPTARANEVAMGVVDIVSRMLGDMEVAYQSSVGAKAFVDVCKLNDEIASFISHNCYVCQKYPVALKTITTIRNMSLFQTVFFMSESEKAIGDHSHGVTTVGENPTIQ